MEVYNSTGNVRKFFRNSKVIFKKGPPSRNRYSVIEGLRTQTFNSKKLKKMTTIKPDKLFKITPEDFVNQKNSYRENIPKRRNLSIEPKKKKTGRPFGTFELGISKEGFLNC